MASEPDIFLVRPSLLTPNARNFSREIYSQLFETEPRDKLTPSSLELRIYESKRELTYFLQKEGIPHPKTHIFLNHAEARSFAKSCTLPQIFKTSTGASSSGVELLKTRRQIVSIVDRLFLSSYARKGLGDYRGIDFGYAIFQEYIADAREYHVIKIGESWFSYEKAKTEKQAFFSGSGVVEWTPSSAALLIF